MCCVFDGEDMVICVVCCAVDEKVMRCVLLDVEENVLGVCICVCKTVLLVLCVEWNMFSRWCV